jgi:hypothetical protein
MLLRSIYVSCLTCGVFWGLGSAPAYAYLDPGTGSMILQVLLGGIAGLALAGKYYWRRFLVVIGMRSEPPAPGFDEQRTIDEPKPRTDR